MVERSLTKYLNLKAQWAEEERAIGLLELERVKLSPGVEVAEVEGELERRRERLREVEVELDELEKGGERKALGRPGKLCDEMIKGLAAGARAGLSKRDLCALVGIHPATLNEWLAQGEAEADRIAGGAAARVGRALFLKLYLGLRMAESEAKLSRLERLAMAGQRGDWRADVWFLEHRYPDEYGRRTEIGITPRPMAPFTAEEAAAAVRDVEAWREGLCIDTVDG